MMHSQVFPKAIVIWGWLAFSVSQVMGAEQQPGEKAGSPAPPAAAASGLGTLAGVPVADATPESLAATATALEKAYEGKTAPEAVRMLIAIARGSRMGAGDGWFGPAENRYTWNWMAKLHQIEPQGAIALTAFLG